MTDSIFSCCNFNAVPKIKKGIIGSSILKKRLVKKESFLSISFKNETIRELFDAVNATPIMPITNPLNKATSLEIHCGICNSNKGSSLSVQLTIDFKSCPFKKDDPKT